MLLALASACQCPLPPLESGIPRESPEKPMSSISPMRYWFDTEFDERGPDIQLISIGIVAEDGRHYHVANADYDKSGANEWL